MAASGETIPDTGQIETLNNLYFCSRKNRQFINYYFSTDLSSPDESNLKYAADFHPFESPEEILDSILLIPIRLASNAGHMQCQVIALLDYLTSLPDKKKKRRFAVSSIVRDLMPHGFQLLCALLGKESLIVLDQGKTYFLKEVTIIQLTHGVGIRNTSQANVHYRNEGIVSTITSAKPIESLFRYNVGGIREYAKNAFLQRRSSLDLYDKVCFIKMAGDNQMGTPHRAITVTTSVRSYLEDLGYQIITITDYSRLEDLVATLYNASRVLTSWGNISIANRFFYSPTATLTLLANRGYEKQWRSKHRLSTMPEPMHVFPVAQQNIVFDFPDLPSILDLQKFEHIL